MNMIANSNQVVPQVPQDSVPPPKDRYISYFVAPLKTNIPRSRFDRFMDKLYIIIANLFRLDAADNHLRRYLDKNFDLFRKSYEDLMGLALNNSDKFGDLTSSHIEALFERFIIDMILDDETVKESVKESVRDNILNNDNPLSTLNEYDGVLDFAKLLFQRKCYTSGDEITNYLKTQYHCGNIWDFDFTPEQQLNLFIEALLHYENLCTASMLKLEGETLKSVESLKMIPVEGSNAYTIPCIKTGEKYSEFVEVLCFPEVPDSIRSSTYPTFKRRIDLLNGALTEHLLFAIEQYKEANKNGENITKPLEIDDSIFDFYADIIKEPNTLPDENEVRGIYLESCNKVSNLLVEFKKLNGNYIKIQSILKDLENNNELINISKINTVEELNKSLELIIKIDEIKVKLKDLGCELQVSEIDYTRVISLIKDYYENNYPIISQNVRTLSDTSFNTLKKVCSNEVCSNEVCSNGSINDLCVDNDDSQSNHSGSTNNTKNEESLNNDKFERLEEKLDLLKVNPEDLKKLGFVKVSETYENINFIYDVNLDIQEDCFHLNAVVNIIHASRQQKNKHDEYVQQLNSYIEGSKFMRFQDLQAVYDFHKTLNYGGNKDSYELLTGLLENAFCTLLTQDLEANEYYKIISLYSNFAGEKFDLFEINSHLINNSIIELYNALCGINQKFSATVSTAIDKLITNLPAMIKVKILEYVLDNNDIKEFSGKHLVMLNSLYHNSDRETMINNFCKNKLSFDDSCNVVINKLSKVLEGIEDAEIKKNCLFTLLEFLQIYNKKDRSLDYKLLMKLPFYVTQQLGLIELIINVNNVINKANIIGFIV